MNEMEMTLPRHYILDVKQISQIFRWHLSTAEIYK